MPLYTQNQDLNRIQLYLEKEIERVRQEIGQNTGGGGTSTGSGIKSFELSGQDLILTDSNDTAYRIDLSPILERVSSFSLDEGVLKIITTNREFMVTLPERDVIRGFEIDGKTLNLETDEEDYSVDLSGIAGKLTDFSITGRVISLTYDGKTEALTIPDSETITSFTRSGNVLTLTTSKGTKQVNLPVVDGGDTISEIKLISDTILQIVTDQKTHSLTLPTGGDTIKGLKVDNANTLILETNRGNFTTPIQRQGDIIEGLRVVDGKLFLDILGKESLSVTLPVGTGGGDDMGGDDDDNGDSQTPQVPTGQDTRSFLYALLSENREIILTEDGSDFIVSEEVQGHLEGLPAGREIAVLTEEGEVLLSEEGEIITYG